MGAEWTDEDSAQFLNLADVITPSRMEQMRMLLKLIPAHNLEPLRVVELGCGGGELASMILNRFPNARYLGLDGSQVMLSSTSQRLQQEVHRVELRSFDLADFRWRRELPQPVHCFVSSLVVHHLTDAEKRALYQDLFNLLEPGGAVLFIDIVLPVSESARAAISSAWDEAVREQSNALTGSDKAYQDFVAGHWNCYAYPDPMDRPAPLFTQLQWLQEIGYAGVDCFWQRAGHAIFGGYKYQDASGSAQPRSSSGETV